MEKDYLYRNGKYGKYNYLYRNGKMESKGYNIATTIYS